MAAPRISPVSSFAALARCVPLALVLALLAGCATSPTGRSQFIAVSDAQMDQLGATAFAQMKQNDRLSRDPSKIATANCVVDALKVALPPQAQRMAWEVQVFADENPNAFALPGGKVGVNTGMWTVAKTQDELAAVLAHELAHVLSRHAAERVSQQMAAGVALEAAQTYTGSRTSPENTRMLMGALGLGAQLGVMLPFSRAHETEADVLGQQIMAEAGFDPAGAVRLWQGMINASRGGRPPQILSTHPDPQNRIVALQARVALLQPVAAQARASGRRPACRM
ncbi:M48 family metallopeptidase [Silanimonas sp.]|uniref:M48 family metallopeptidase n=1 Tax=Silanimonas sp. TaxID=1929290 RepID=UPI001BC26A55|nr:M48 family metallopeptidase [Silanimonas sp.]MBS3896871.1 M48 family metallopeptidase [Silanimonas sp.]MBS3924798.1 M48 family metallopeptidase [Xanthomonadaceae bacterium]